MGSPSACEQCGKKFKVFTKRKKCLHCMTVVCKYCYAPHLTTKHPSAALRMTPSSQSSHATRQHHARDSHSHAAQHGRATIGTAYEIRGERASGFDDEDDVHFLSPIHANDSRTAMKYEEDLLLDGVEHVNVMSGVDDEDDDDDEDEEEEEDDDDGEEEEEDDAEDEDEAYLVGDDSSNHNENNREKHQRAAAGRFHKRRMSMEEQHYQYAEFLQIQNAVATWARKERDATRKQRVAERDSCYSMTPIPNVRSTREYQEREIFVVSYTVAITLLVWGVHAVVCFMYIRARGEIVPFVLLE
ncbi:hypothetical protein Gpo141_00011299 [Globisporangium polare]